MLAHLDKDRNVEYALNRLVPHSLDRGDWNDVLASYRVKRWRPRLSWHALAGKRARVAAVAIAAVALSTAVPALALTEGWWSSSPDLPTPVAQPVEVTTITEQDGTTRTLTAYLSTQNGLCIGLAQSPTNLDGAALSCGAGTVGEPKQTSSDANEVSFTTTPGFIFGDTASDVSSVRIASNDGQTSTVPTVPAPNGLGAQVRFYISALPANAQTTAVSALDTSGVVIQTRTVPALPVPTTTN